MLKLARKIAQKSTHKRFKHAAIVLKGGAILSVGFNHDTIHAEVAALKKLWPNKRKGVTVVSLRFTKRDNFGNSRPCNDCIKFMNDNGVAKIQYAEIGYWMPLENLDILRTERL